MAISLPDLPYARNALAPAISEETLDYHYGKHHKAYVDKTNAAIEGTDLANASLEDIVKQASGGLFNNAAQVWNHSFYWDSMAPGGVAASSTLSSEIDKAFGSMNDFVEQFKTSAAGNFGSGWTWLVKNAGGSLEIVNTDDAETPITAGHTALLTVDVWEHAYYIDYRNARPGYLDAFMGLVNWGTVEQRLNA